VTTAPSASSWLSVSLDRIAHTTYVDAVYCYRLSSMVCLSLSRSVAVSSSAKTQEPIEIPFAMRSQVGPGKHVLDGGPDPPMGRGNFEGEGASHCKVQGHVHPQHFLATRHTASTSMYSLTFRVRVATPAQYGRNGTTSLQITSRTQQPRRFHRWCVRA